MGAGVGVATTAGIGVAVAIGVAMGVAVAIGVAAAVAAGVGVASAAVGVAPGAAVSSGDFEQEQMETKQIAARILFIELFREVSGLRYLGPEYAR